MINQLNLAEPMRRAAGVCLQLLFPRRCPVCDGIVTPFGEKICLECIPRLKPVAPPRCMKCGKHLGNDRMLCGDCAKKHHKYDAGRALYDYRSAALPIYRLKYGGRREYADCFGEQMALLLGDFIRGTGADGLVPVPLHPRRLAARGYNQAELLARALGRCCGLPVYPKMVKRVRNTTPLKLLDPEERQKNLKKAFIIAQNDVKLKSVIIVDDIYTTGSTIDELTETLKENGTEKVYFVTLSAGSGV